MRLTADERVLYAQAIWYEFQQKAKTTREMSSAEFLLVHRWLEREIPLVIVLRGLQDFSGRPRRLEALQSAVEAAYRYWRQAAGLIPEDQSVHES